MQTLSKHDRFSHFLKGRDTVQSWEWKVPMFPWKCSVKAARRRWENRSGSQFQTDKPFCWKGLSFHDRGLLRKTIPNKGHSFSLTMTAWDFPSFPGEATATISMCRKGPKHTQRTQNNADTQLGFSLIYSNVLCCLIQFVQVGGKTSKYEETTIEITSEWHTENKPMLQLCICSSMCLYN